MIRQIVTELIVIESFGVEECWSYIRSWAELWVVCHSGCAHLFFLCLWKHNIGICTSRWQNSIGHNVMVIHNLVWDDDKIEISWSLNRVWLRNLSLGAVNWVYVCNNVVAKMFWKKPTLLYFSIFCFSRMLKICHPRTLIIW